MKLVKAISCFFALFGSAAAFGAPPFTDAQMHCAAWKTKKTMFLVQKIEPVGVNCGITVTVEPTEDGKLFITGRFPIKGFDSGEPDRDKEVLLILKAAKQADLIWRSESKIAAEWQQFLSMPEGNLKGTLNVAGEEFPVEFSTKNTRSGDKVEVQGSHVGTYKAFKIEPPSVAFGVVAKADDYLELHIRLQSDQVTGAADILR